MQTNCHLGEMDAWYSERRKPKFCKRRSLQSWNLFLGFFLIRQVVSACNSMITQEHFKLLAAYNRWANARLYAAALDLSELSYRLHTGVYFGGLHGTLNHLLLTDRLWLKRLTGEGDLPNDLNAILYED